MYAKSVEVRPHVCNPVDNVVVTVTLLIMLWLPVEVASMLMYYSGPTYYVQLAIGCEKPMFRTCVFIDV